MSTATEITRRKTTESRRRSWDPNATAKATSVFAKLVLVGIGDSETKNRKIQFRPSYDAEKANRVFTKLTEVAPLVGCIGRASELWTPVHLHGS